MNVLFRLIFIVSFFIIAVEASANQSTKIVKDLKPTVIVISIDSFRNDYLDKLPVPNLQSLAKKGTRSSLIPVFPSITFPNHYSIATGLYPEHHGIMLNEFISTDIKELFTHDGHVPSVTDPRWWKGEPIWVTADKQGQKTASAFWPGSAYTIKNSKPYYFQDFKEDGNPQVRVQQMLKWLDLPSDQRPTLIMGYFENVDNAGHLAGPDSVNVRKAAIQVDDAIGSLVKGLKARGIESKVNLIVLADHGMTKVDPKKTIDLMKFIKAKDLKTISDEGAVVGIYPKPDRVNAIYQALKQAHAPMKVYRASEIPANLHFHSTRTPPIIAIADEHVYILGQSREVLTATHGYDSSLKSMQTVFIASGPAFKRGYLRPAFENVNVYSLLSKILGLKAASNDGSLSAIKDILQ